MKNISFIGGDKRNLILSNLLEKEGFNIFRYGLGIEKNSLLECTQNSELIITAVPFSTDFENIYCPLDQIKLKVYDFINLLNKKTIVCGKISKQFITKLHENNNKIVDIMANEQLALKNTIPTVEGIVKIIIENTDITIDDSNIAVLGFGRVGKRTAKILNCLGGNIFCYDIKEEAVANIKLCGYNVIDNIHEILNKMDIIVNTIPEVIIKKQVLQCINKKTFIIDVSSKPGGIDFEYANNNGYKVIHALGLPGKIAPITSAKYIKEIIQNLII